MKRIFAVIALCLLLLDGGYHLSVFMKDELVHFKTSIYCPKSKKQHKYISKGFVNLAADFTDLEIEDDSSDSNQKINKSNSLFKSNIFLKKWHKFFAPVLLLKKTYIFYNSLLFLYLKEIPIYIKNSVLII